MNWISNTRRKNDEEEKQDFLATSVTHSTTSTPTESEISEIG